MDRGGGDRRSLRGAHGGPAAGARAPGGRRDSPNASLCLVSLDPPARGGRLGCHHPLDRRTRERQRPSTGSARRRDRWHDCAGATWAGLRQVTDRPRLAPDGPLRDVDDGPSTPRSSPPGRGCDRPGDDGIVDRAPRFRPSWPAGGAIPAAGPDSPLLRALAVAATRSPGTLADQRSQGCRGRYRCHDRRPSPRFHRSSNSGPSWVRPFGPACSRTEPSRRPSRSSPATSPSHRTPSLVPTGSWRTPGWSKAVGGAAPSSLGPGRGPRITADRRRPVLPCPCPPPRAHRRRGCLGPAHGRLTVTLVSPSRSPSGGRRRAPGGSSDTAMRTPSRRRRRSVAGPTPSAPCRNEGRSLRIHPPLRRQEVLDVSEP